MAEPQLTPVRLQEYGVGLFSSCSTKSALKKCIAKGLVFVNGKKARTATFIHGGEHIECYSEELNEAKRVLQFPLKVLFEDDHIAAIYKPAGIQVSGNKFKTIANALAQNLTKSPLPNSSMPQPAHRLDYPTTGILLVGKTSAAIRALNTLFEEKRICKTYYAVSMGKMTNEQGEFNEPVADKNASTNYLVLESVSSERFKYLNLVKLTPKTGRKHQIRKHLSAAGNAILGDKEYSPKDLILKGKGLYLHAYSVKLEHPFTGEKLTLTAEVPKKFKKLFNYEF